MNACGSIAELARGGGLQRCGEVGEVNSASFEFLAGFLRHGRPLIAVADLDYILASHAPSARLSHTEREAYRSGASALARWGAV
mmetsp:Transcript_63236/g.159487  ORF Transcript_63236/g.159487 Transcript_63236/m.159487 type:complete len:84 (+) Transcript_63236:248-499(+)|eukprot:CAMPEP_0115189130 /NCGR_PEP_ID=MMETSP0270-20121206/11362_1 /TAXON_ID=71861 /ORGANISM="Scrippsiella trochoidea, Strain CCMP3099" /LENGTH=83 /DNA_ID=CAMNT_0002602323 /DNA_START=152 /DNA_END=403 /DNA_ORIENTATION=+